MADGGRLALRLGRGVEEVFVKEEGKKEESLRLETGSALSKQGGSGIRR